ncbi:MAG: hypothetical protein K2H82_06095 [Oscillospiraceae bacterium]|nr:hypothetical protein [Oscillospiraceae bacterium]
MKQKGIIIELTSLLDVIFIILFWVMMQMQQQQTELKSDTESRLAQADQQVQDALAQVEEIQSKADQEITEAWKTAEELNQKAFDNQKALDSFSQGNLITIYLDYAPDGIISVSEQREILAEFSLELSETVISERILQALENSRIGENPVILCALVYDGDTALYKDVLKLNAILKQVSDERPDFYCAVMNTARNSGKNSEIKTERR